MSVTNFIPTLWSARLLRALEKSHVATNFINRDYEGIITGQGDTVKINVLKGITINDYTKNKDIVDAEILDTDLRTLEISQAKYFNFLVDDVDKVQSAGNLVDAAMSESSYQLSDVADKYIFATIAAGVKDGNRLDSIKLTASNIYERIVALRTLMDKANVPTAGRKIAIPPEAYALLLLDERFTKADATAQDTIVNGFVGKVAGFEVFESNNLPTDSETQATSIIASVPSATTYAEQIVSIKAYEAEKRFADGVKGLHVYGAANVNPERIAVLPATF
jgi:N4-gp56 family major capsid protein